MVNANQRARTIAGKAIAFLREDSVFDTVYDGIDIERKERIFDKIVLFVERELEEYAGNRPITPKTRVVLEWPDASWTSCDNYIRNKMTGELIPVEIKRKQNGNRNI